ncbi:MAG: tRNA (cytidine(34)-2'-O)-methyltransferase [Clostridia bacterium]|nr:tRNA (cytidine(34)-2'-O)-methyltransferase [Clostridia bacterium]
MINIVLIEPEIPQNAGNIIRTCAVTGAKLYMVRPLGFSLDDKHYKRAGLDYFDKSNITIVNTFDEIKEIFKDIPIYYASTKGQRRYSDVDYTDGDCAICFGRESYGIREDILKENYQNCIRIPMKENLRSLNLSNSVAIVLYEALRQNDFAGLETKGRLTGRKEG